jgi:hypothetical protein
MSICPDEGERGSITAMITVLVEGGDMEEPTVGELSGILVMNARLPLRRQVRLIQPQRATRKNVAPAQASGVGAFLSCRPRACMASEST